MGKEWIQTSTVRKNTRPFQYFWIKVQSVEGYALQAGATATGDRRSLHQFPRDAARNAQHIQASAVVLAQKIRQLVARRQKPVSERLRCGQSQQPGIEPAS